MYAQPGKDRSEFARGYDLGCAATVFIWLCMQTSTVLDRRAVVKPLSTPKKLFLQIRGRKNKRGTAAWPPSLYSLFISIFRNGQFENGSV